MSEKRGVHRSRRARMWSLLAAAPIAISLMQGASAEDVASIGVAHMETDGTITLRLIARGDNGMTGEGQFVYKPGVPHYREVLDHLHGLAPGEYKSVPPWAE